MAYDDNDNEDDEQSFTDTSEGGGDVALAPPPSQPVPSAPARLSSDYLSSIKWDAPTQAPPTQPSSNYLSSIKWDDEPQPKAESEPVTGLREFAHNILPGAVGVGAGILATPFTTPLGGALAGAGAFLAARKAQDEGLKAIGLDDSKQMAINAAVNPKSALAGSLASGLPFFGVGPAATGVRALGAGLGAGLEAGSEYLQGGDFDPTRIIASGAAGAVLTRPTALTQRYAAALGHPMTAPAAQPAAEPGAPPPPPLGTTPENLTSALRDIASEQHPEDAKWTNTVADGVEKGTYGQWLNQPPAALRAAAMSHAQAGNEYAARTFNTLADAADRARVQAGQTALPSGAPDVSEQPDVAPSSKVTAAARAKAAPQAGPITSALRNIMNESLEAGNKDHAQSVWELAATIDHGGYSQLVRQAPATLRATATSMRQGGNERYAQQIEALAAAKERVRTQQKTTQTGVTMTPNERGTAAPMPKPTGEPVGQPKVGQGSETQYGKAKPPPGPGAGVKVLEPGEMPAAQAAALDAINPPAQPPSSPREAAAATAPPPGAATPSAAVAPQPNPVTAAMRGVAGEISRGGNPDQARFVAHLADSIDNGGYDQLLQQSPDQLRTMAAEMDKSGDSTMAQTIRALATAKERVVPLAEPAAPAAAPAPTTSVAPGERIQFASAGAQRRRAAAPAPGPAESPAAGAAPKLSKAERQSKAGLAAAARAEAAPGYDAAAIKAMQDTAAAHAASEQRAAAAPAEAPARSAAADAIDDHVRTLGNAGTDETAFNAALDAVSRDPDVGNAEATEISRQYSGIGGNEISKPAALRLIKNAFSTRAIAGAAERAQAASAATKAEPVQPAELPPISAPARDPDTNRWVLFRGDDALEGDYANKGEALKARNRILMREAAAKRAATQQAILEAGARRTEEGAPAGMTPPPGTQTMARQTPAQALAARRAARGAGPAPPGGPPPRATAPGPASPLPAPPPLPLGQQLSATASRVWDSIKNVLAPQTRGPQARAVADMIRKTYSNATQLMEQTKAVLAQHRDTINAMSPDDLRALVNKAQGGTAYPNWQPNAAQQAALTDIKNVTDAWAAKLGTLSRAQQQQWIDDYLPGMYKNPTANQQFFTSRGAGGGGSLKQKFFPDYETARAAGLEPYTNNPLEMLDLYGQKMRNFIGRQEALESGLQSGLFIQPRTYPQAVGAAGAPQPLIKSSMPPNYVESKVQSGLFMPEEVVHAWDNFHMAGLRSAQPGVNNAYDVIKEMNTAWTNLELSLNAYHFFTMTNESMIADVAMGLEKVAGGKTLSGLSQIAKAPIAPYTRYQQGKAIQEAYLDRYNTDPVLKSLVDAGFRPIGRSNALDANTAYKTFMSSFKNLPQQLNQAIKDMRQDWTDAQGNVLAQVQYPFKQAGRIVSTLSHPLFDVYIPRLKAGAAYAQMEHWRDMNPTKVGTPEEGANARRILDSLDNRFGEMTTDHLFMNKMVQDMGVAGLRSFSWLMGTLKEIGGGTYSAARGAAQAARTGDLSRLNMLNPASPHYDPRVAYVVAMPMTIAAASAAYQYLLGSHDAPASWRDLYAPRTGGMVKSVGQVVPEHMLMPGYHKDIHSWLHDPLMEAYNKLGGVWSTAIEEARGRGSPAIGSPLIVRPNATVTQDIADRMSYLFDKMGPIGVKAYVKGQKDGSQIPDWMAAAGFHAPGADILNPEGLDRLLSKQSTQEWKRTHRGQPAPAQ